MVTSVLVPLAELSKAPTWHHKHFQIACQFDYIQVPQTLGIKPSEVARDVGSVDA